MIKLLCDIGGTHMRVAIDRGDGFDLPMKYAVADFASIDLVWRRYLEETGHPANACRVGISCAATRDGEGLYRFSNNPLWVIDPAALSAQGWVIDCIVNDFCASAWGTLALRPEDVETVYPGAPDAGATSVILGPGTGLGLGFIMPLPGGGHHIQMTHGGHMMTPLLTDEHFLMAELVRRIKGNGHTVIPEDFCSGRGLPILYRAVCEAYAYPAVHTCAAEILDHPRDPAVREALRLFHEFLGMFAHVSMVTGNAYGGVYLDGGVMHHLRERHLFDARVFMNFLRQNPVPSVARSLAQAPVHLVLEPYIALRGLQVMAEQEQQSCAS